MNADYIGFRIYDDWIRLVRNGKSIKTFFYKNGYKRIAIYGIGLIGKQIYDELYGSNVEVVYGIDQNADKIFLDGLDVIPLERIDHRTDQIDAVIITPILSFYGIEKELLKIYGGVDFISVRDMVWYSK